MHVLRRLGCVAIVWADMKLRAGENPRSSELPDSQPHRGSAIAVVMAFEKKSGRRSVPLGQR